MQSNKDIRLDILTEDARRELLDFYDYLVLKYGKRKVETKERKKLFLETIERHLFNLPRYYRFNREDIHER
ncbi:MAG: hypothetical protein HY886_07585 [Deltaproteobacteria bacterium]|nr:hypothetical protein [Deltaproteobacteria bacterium]